MEFLLFGFCGKHRPRRPRRPRRLLLLFLVLYLCVAWGGPCPQPCRCQGKLRYCEGVGLTGVPQNLSGSAGLSLRRNHLSSLTQAQFARLTQLDWLFLGHNKIEALDERAFKGLRRLRELDLSENSIETLADGTFQPLSNLRDLDLSHNRLRFLSHNLFLGLRKLASLHLQHNVLGSVPVLAFQDCRRLLVLDLSHNRVRSLARNAFAGLVRLTELHLEQNALGRLNLGLFPRLASLRSLHLGQNRISALGRTLHWSWPSLQCLDLSRNVLEWIEPGVFRGIPGLRTLQLHTNRLRGLEPGVLEGWAALTSVTLAGNPWDCGCGVCALAAWLGLYRGRSDGEPVCATPENAEGESVLDAVHAFQTCDPPWNVTMETDTITDHVARGFVLREPAGSPDEQRNADNRELTTSSVAEAVTVASGKEQDSSVPKHRTVMACVSVLSLFVLGLHATRKFFPASAGRLCRRRQARRQVERQEADLNYNSQHAKGALVITHDYGPCTCHLQPSRECEV